jgi:uncharacterized protein (DUF697 family)
MSQEQNDNDQLLLILLTIGFTKDIADKLVNLASKNVVVRELIQTNDVEGLLTDADSKKIIKKELPRISGVTQILIDAGLTVAIAGVIANAFAEDEKIPQLIDEGKRPLIFMTQQDSKVDDLICLPLEGTVWDIDDPQRPQIPATTHPNCRCFWIDPSNGANLGQF